MDDSNFCRHNSDKHHRLDIHRLLYTVALIDGHLIQFQKYRSTETTLLYTNDQEREVAVPLTSIDFDRTRQLNSGENPPLDLPGMQAESTSKTSDSQVSLAEVARKTARGATPPAKRIFTDDDVARSSVGDLQSNATPVTFQDAKTAFDAAEAFASRLGDKTERELGEMEVGEVQFPGRDRWEARLFNQKERLLKATRVGIDAGRRSVQALSDKNPSSYLTEDEQLEMQEKRNALKSQLSNIRLERYRFDQIVAEGVRAASEWKRARDK